MPALFKELVCIYVIDCNSYQRASEGQKSIFNTYVKIKLHLSNTGGADFNLQKKPEEILN